MSEYRSMFVMFFALMALLLVFCVGCILRGINERSQLLPASPCSFKCPGAFCAIVEAAKADGVSVNDCRFGKCVDCTGELLVFGVSRGCSW